MYKLLLTSRFQEVLCNDMGLEKCFLLDALPDNEATNLFAKKIRGSIQDSDLQRLATQIVEECAGIPIVITMIANSLRSTKSFSTWSTTLEELKESNRSDIRGMHRKVFSSVELAYNSLDNEEAKSLLLLCSLYGEDARISIECLVRYGVGMNLFPGLMTIDPAKNKLLTLVQILKNFGFLLECDSIHTVQMHDIFREVVMTVTTCDGRMHNMRNCVELDEQLQKNGLKDEIAISVLDKDRADKKVHQNLDCQQLEFFFGFWEHNVWQISDHLFEEISYFSFTYFSFRFEKITFVPVFSSKSPNALLV